MDQLLTSPAEILDLQQAIVDRIATEEELDPILDDLCRLVEAIRPGSICSHMRIDPDSGNLFVRAAPCVPPALVAQLDGLVPGELAGACGAAVYRNEMVIVEDAQVDPRWESMRDAAIEFGIRSCWSIPIRVNESRVVGTFAISGSKPGRPNPEEVRLLETASHLAAMAIVLDESRERVRRQQQEIEAVLRSQKAESLDQMAGGVAHEFNNILTSILTSAEGVMRDRHLSGLAREGLESVCMGAMRARELTQMMLSYAGKAESRQRHVDLTGMVDELVELAELALSKSATIEKRVEPDLPSVEADAGQIRQVMLNLICNATEAYEGDPGTVTVELKPASLDGSPAVELVVGDTGVGMDEGTRARVFDPFFSTKFAGRGLGLAAVHGIVRAHGGEIHVESAPAEGSTFRVVLPAARE